MAKATVVRQVPKPQPEPPIAEVTLVLTPGEAELLYGLIGTFSINEFNNRMKACRRDIRLSYDDLRIYEIYKALHAYAKDGYNFL